MPVMIHVDREAQVEQRDLSKGVPLDLGGQSEVVLTKYISANPNRATWQPAEIWEEQVTVDVGGGRRSVRVGIQEPSGRVRSVNIDDGLIIDLEGRMAGLYGILPGRAPMGEEEVQAYIDQTERTPPMFQRWDFRVVRVKKTNGPEERMKMHRTDDQKRMNAQAEMFREQMEAFRAIKEMLLSGGQQLAAAGELAPEAGAAMKAGLTAAEQAEGLQSKIVSAATPKVSGPLTKQEKSATAVKAASEGIKTE